MLNRGETLKLRDLNAAFTEPADDLARLLPGVAARRAPRRALTATRACTSCCAPTRKGLDTDAALKSALEHRLRRAAGRLRPDHRERGSARCARRSRPPEDDGAARRCRSTRCGRSPTKHPDSYPVQMVLGTRAARRRASSTRRCRRSSAPRRSCRSRPATTARTRRSPQIALEKKDTPRAIAALAGAAWRRLRQHRGGAAARDAAARERTSPIPPRFSPVYERIAAIDPFDAEAHAALGRLALQRGRCRTRRSASSAPSSRSARSTRPAAHTDLAESYLEERPARRGAQADARRARDRAELRARAGPAAEAARRQAVNARRRSRARAVASLAGRRRCSSCCRARALPPPRRRAAAGSRPTTASPACSGASSASSTTTSPKAPRVAQDFYGEPWVIDAPGRRAEPVAPPARRRPRFRSRIRSC